MTEREYIDATNLAKLRIALTVLGDYHPSAQFAYEREKIYNEIQRLEFIMENRPSL